MRRVCLGLLLYYFNLQGLPGAYWVPNHAFFSAISALSLDFGRWTLDLDFFPLPFASIRNAF